MNFIELNENELLEVDAGGLVDFVVGYVAGKVVDYALPKVAEAYYDYVYVNTAKDLMQIGKNY